MCRYLVGYFTDNELPLYPVEIFPYCTVNFFRREEVGDALKNLVSEWDEKHFTYEVSVRYYAAVVQAIRAVDPHHLVLGSRLHGAAKSNKYLNGFEQIPELRLSGILSEVPTMLTWM